MTITQVQPLNIPTALKLTESGAPKGSLWAGLLQVLGNRYERKSAAAVALVFFVGSIALAPALTRDQKKLAAEINHKTLKAAAAIKSSTRRIEPISTPPAAARTTSADMKIPSGLSEGGTARDLKGPYYGAFHLR